jgi:hypothetical protein
MQFKIADRLPLMVMYNDVKSYANLIVNEDGLGTFDFRAEGDNDQYLLFSDASADSVGIGASAPGAKLHITGTKDDQQLIIDAYSTQTNNIIEVKNSSTNDILTLADSGTLTLTGNFATGTNNTYDIGTTSARMKDVYAQGSIQIGANGDSGSIRYNTTDNQLEFSNDGSTWIAMSDLSKTITLSAEYPGAILSSDGSDNIGSMTSDSESYTKSSMNYYEWNSSETSLQDYDVRVRFTLPDDFLSWGTNAMVFNYVTEAAAATNNKFSIYLFGETSAAADAYIVDEYSNTAATWETGTIPNTDMDHCTEPGDTCVILLRMYSANDSYTRVGDIDITYNRKL